MNGVAESVSSKKERVERALMVWGAVVLFGLGLLLLMAAARPRDSRAASAGDNGMHQRAAGEHCKSGWYCA